jgi:hypothetical protein
MQVPVGSGGKEGDYGQTGRNFLLLFIPDSDAQAASFV